MCSRRGGIVCSWRWMRRRFYVEQSMQRYLWLMAVSLHDAYGFGPERLHKFFEAFQENSDELAKMRAEVDDDYAFEKLRLRAEDVSRMDIRYYGKLKID